MSMPLQVIPGIYQIKVPMGIPDNPLGCTNTYLIEGEGGWTLIDAGWNGPASFASFEKDLKELGLDFADIQRIIITHAHPDHYGLASSFRDASGRAQIAIHRNEMPSIERHRDPEVVLRKMLAWLDCNGVPPQTADDFKTISGILAKIMPPLKPDRILQGGEVIPAGKFSLEVLHTPGHADGHICLYERSRGLLFAGDHILPQVTPNISLSPFSESNPLGDYLASISAISRMAVNTVLPAHEEIFQDLAGRIAELKGHHDERKNAILGTLQNESKTAFDLSSEIPWGLDMGGIAWEDMTHLDRRMAVSEALAHLEALRAEGKVVRFEKDGMFLYQSIQS